MSELAGKTVLVTGGGSGVGAAMALAFANAGARVSISGRSETRLQMVADNHESITSVVADVTDEQSVMDMFATCGPTEIVIANAGMSDSTSFQKTEIASWQQLIDVNLTGVFLTLREGLKQIPEQSGRLIAIASTASLKGYPYVAPYAAAKHGVIGLVRSLALELAKTNTTVNAICPGFLDTEMTDRSVANIMDKTGKTEQQARVALAAHNPQGRLISPDEVAETALWLSREGARSVNGQAITLSGGEI